MPRDRKGRPKAASVTCFRLLRRPADREQERARLNRPHSMASTLRERRHRARRDLLLLTFNHKDEAPLERLNGDRARSGVLVQLSPGPHRNENDPQTRGLQERFRSTPAWPIRGKPRDFLLYIESP
jgi:hypothetical protein